MDFRFNMYVSLFIHYVSTGISYVNWFKNYSKASYKGHNLKQFTFYMNISQWEIKRYKKYSLFILSHFITPNTDLMTQSNILNSYQRRSIKSKLNFMLSSKTIQA